MYTVCEAVRQYQKLILTPVRILALTNRPVTMDEEEKNGNTDIIQLEKALLFVVTAIILPVDMKFSSKLLADQHAYSEENIPLSSQSWLWKKNNFISCADKSQNRPEAWVQRVTPSDCQTPEDSVRINHQTKSQTTIHSSVPLPGSITDYSEEIQEHASCVIKSVMIDDKPEEEDGDGNSWLHKLGMNISKWSFLNSLTGWSQNRSLEKVDHLNTSGVCSAADHKATQVEDCKIKEVPYIPYKLSILYIVKLVKDMEEMKNKHMKIIRQLNNIWKENQENTVTTIKKHYGEKLKHLKSQLEAYRELMNRSNAWWQDTVKNLRERNRQLIQEKEDLLHQVEKQTEKWEKEKVQILENLCKTLDYLYTQHLLTLQELRNINLYVEEVQDLMNVQIKILQQKSEKEEGEQADVSEAVILKSEQVANENRKPEWSIEKGYLWQAHIMLKKIQESLQKQEREVSEILQTERRYNKAMKPQMTVLSFLKTLVKKVHTMYCDVPGAQQYISHLIRKNKDESVDQKEAFNNTETDILSYEVFYGNEPPMDDKRAQFSMKLLTNLGKAKSDIEYVEAEKIVFDCIQTGVIPNWIKRDCLYMALTEDLASYSKGTDPPDTGTHAEV